MAQPLQYRSNRSLLRIRLTSSAYSRNLFGPRTELCGRPTPKCRLLIRPSLKTDVLVFVCLFFFVRIRLRISPQKINSYRRQILHGGSSASKAGILPFLWTLLSLKPKIGRIGQHAHHLQDVYHNDYFASHRLAYRRQTVPGAWSGHATHWILFGLQYHITGTAEPKVDKFLSR